MYAAHVMDEDVAAFSQITSVSMADARRWLSQVEGGDLNRGLDAFYNGGAQQQQQRPAQNAPGGIGIQRGGNRHQPAAAPPMVDSSVE